MAVRLLLAVLLLFVSVSLAQAQSQAPRELGWPRELIQGNTVLRYYQPQIDSWQDRKLIKARMAVVLAGQDFPKPLAGALWIQADTAVNLDARMVVLNDIKVDRISFAVLDKATAEKAESAVRAIVPKGPVTTSLDRVLAGLPESQAPRRAVPLKQDPPKIFYSETPARLLIFDGQPAMAPIAGTSLQYALNTNWTVVNEMATSSFYLLDDKTWLAANAINGPWTLAKRLPEGLSRLPDDDNWKDARAAVAAFKPPGPDARKPPRIIVTGEPAELIVTAGKPQLGAAGPDTGRLQVVVNTDSDLFFAGSDQRWYYLVAGRWFRAASLSGPWSFASKDLPPDFKNLPADGKKARALYSVPGTPQAQEAVLVASIPQTATVLRAEAKAEIVYHGEPKFEPIEGTGLFYAVNSQPPVVRYTPAAYYVVDRGVWFTSPAPTGPWTVATSVPPEIYAIPPSSPLYYYTYVVIDGATDQEVVSSYTEGYLGSYIVDDMLYWGTGYYYPPYWASGGYWPWPYTYGAAAWYNAATNTYYRGGAVYGPYGGFGAGAAYNASTGTYARGVAAYGPYGGFKAGAAYNPTTGAWARGAAGYGPNGAFRAGSGYNPTTGVGAAGIRGSNVYGSWGRGVVTKGDQWAQGGYRTNAAGGGVAGIRTSEGTGAIGYRTAGGDTGGIVKGQNNTYVGNDGNVYRKTDSGWQKWDNGAWTNPERPTPQRGQTPEVARGSGQRDLANTLQGGSGAQNAQQLDRRQFDQQNLTRPSGRDQFDRQTFERQSLDRDYASRRSGVQREMNFNRQYSGGRSFSGGGGGFRGGGGGRGGRR